MRSVIYIALSFEETLTHNIRVSTLSNLSDTVVGVYFSISYDDAMHIFTNRLK